MVFLSGPVVKTLPSNAGSASSVDSWLGIKIPQASRGGQ